MEITSDNLHLILSVITTAKNHLQIDIQQLQDYLQHCSEEETETINSLIAAYQSQIADIDEIFELLEVSFREQLGDVFVDAFKTLFMR